MIKPNSQSLPIAQTIRDDVTETVKPDAHTMVWWESKPVRTCYSMHDCKICGYTIVAGEEYRDAGRLLAHHKCVAAMRVEKIKEVE